MRSEYIPRALSAILTLSLMWCSTACGGFFSSNSPSSTPTTPTTQTVAVAITPGTVALPVNGTQQFTVSVTGTSNSAVTWSLTETIGGTLDSKGMYTAPSKAAVYHVIATSQADTTKSATAAVTVTAPAPVFSSGPSTGGLEATQYTYTVVASDPAGTAVTLALTTAPTGAVWAGNTVTWTPTSAQSRVPNNFTVTATTDAGGTASQSWTATPNGTVYVTKFDTYWTVNGSQPLANDLSSWSMAALVPQADGSLLSIPGTGAFGTFNIPNVPAGYFWLQVDASDFYWTSSSNFDCGSDYAGRPNTGASLVVATLDWYLTDLTPWTMTDNLYGMSPNANASFIPGNYPISVGDVTFDSQGDQTFAAPPIDPTQGDLTYLLQTSFDTSNPLIDLEMTDSIGETPLSVINDGDVAYVSAAMLPLFGTQTMDLNIDFSSYNQAETSTNFNSTASAFEGRLWKQPIVADRAIQNWLPPNPSLQFLHFSAFTVPFAAQDFGTFNYGNLLPAEWPTLFYFDVFGQVDTLNPATGTTVQVTYDIGHVGTTVPTTTQPDRPVMSAIQSPTINGANFFNSATLIGSLTMSWSVPTGLAPYGYRVDIYTVDPLSGAVNNLPTSLYTPTRSITIPSQSLISGTYIFNVEALADSLANMATSPFRNGYPQAWADAVSGVVTYTGTASASPFMAAVSSRSPVKFQLRRQMRHVSASRTAQRITAKHL